MPYSGFLHADGTDDIDYAQSGWDYYKSWETEVHGVGYDGQTNIDIDGNRYAHLGWDYFEAQWESDISGLQNPATIDSADLCYGGKTKSFKRKGKKRGKGKSGALNGGGGGPAGTSNKTPNPKKSKKKKRKGAKKESKHSNQV